LRELQFGSVLEAAAHEDLIAREAAAASAANTASLLTTAEAASLQLRLRNVVAQLGECRWFMSLVLVCLAFAVLLVLRPPFVLVFKYDATRPWRGSSSICWLSLTVVAFVTAALSAAAPFLLPLLV
jgi:hypothetical protein